jgi:hypothetical protein
MLCKLDYESGERGSYFGCANALPLELGFALRQLSVSCTECPFVELVFG